MGNVGIDKEDLGCTYSTENPLSLFFQTGYLTMVDCDGENSAATPRSFAPSSAGMRCPPTDIKDSPFNSA